MQDVLSRIASLRLVPVIVLEKSADAAPLGDALAAGGLPVAEVTFRTSAAEESLRILSARGDLLVGAGTVLDVETARRAIGAGAAFIVCPGFSPKVVRYCLDQHVAVLPGIATPTDLTMVLDHGLSAAKFFPAEALGGAKTLKALCAPFPMMKFVPTGGINQDNLGEYLKLPQVLACGGSWMVARELISAGRFDEITRLTASAVAKLTQTATRPGISTP